MWVGVEQVEKQASEQADGGLKRIRGSTRRSNRRRMRRTRPERKKGWKEEREKGRNG